MGEIKELAKLKNVGLLSIAPGMSDGTKQPFESLSTDQLKRALELIQKK